MRYTTPTPQGAVRGKILLANQSGFHSCCDCKWCVCHRPVCRHFLQLKNLMSGQRYLKAQRPGQRRTQISLYEQKVTSLFAPSNLSSVPLACGLSILHPKMHGLLDTLSVVCLRFAEAYIFAHN